MKTKKTAAREMIGAGRLAEGKGLSPSGKKELQTWKLVAPPGNEEF